MLRFVKLVFHNSNMLDLRGFNHSMELGINKIKLMHNVIQQNFPYESPWKNYYIGFRELVEQSQTSSQIVDVLEFQKMISEEEKSLRKIRKACDALHCKPFDYFRELIKAVHKHRVQNCGEITRISYAVARMNGIKHSKLDMALLTTKEPKDYSGSLFPEIDRILNVMKEMEYGSEYKILDHVALQIHGKKGKEFVLDALLNECNSKEEIEKIYKTKYGDILKVSRDENIQILNGTSRNSHLPELKDDEAQELLTLYPDLGVFRKAPPPKKNFFFDWFKIGK